MSIGQSFCYSIFQADGDYQPLFKAAAEVGYQATEFWFPGEQEPQRIEQAKQHGLKVLSMIGHHGGLNDCAQHDKIEAELVDSIEFAARHGLAGLICFAGNRIAGQDDSEALVCSAKGLRRVADHAAANGVELWIELLNSRIDHKGFVCDRVSWALALCEMVNHPAVRILFDIYHVQIMEGDVIRRFRQCQSWVGHVHTAGVPGRGDLDDQQELNYPAICRAINHSDYTGLVGHEFKPKGDPAAALAAAFKTCDV